jgi:transposase
MHSRGRVKGRAQQAATGPSEGAHRHDSGGGPACAAQAATHGTPPLRADSARETRVKGSESTVRRYVAWRKQAFGTSKEVCIAQTYAFGEEAQVDRFEAYAEFTGDRQKVNVFWMRSMAAAAAFHRAYFHATQQAFPEAHELAFHWFGGVFAQIRYDNLRATVKKILRGHGREGEETERFTVFRSHWGFEAEFCIPKKPTKKAATEQRTRPACGMPGYSVAGQSCSRVATT